MQVPEIEVLIRPMWGEMLSVADGLTDEQRLRLRCLELAVHGGFGSQTADEFLTFVRGTSIAEREIDRLARYIVENIPGEPSQEGSAVDCAIRLLAAGHAPETFRHRPDCPTRAEWASVGAGCDGDCDAGRTYA